MTNKSIKSSSPWGRLGGALLVLCLLSCKTSHSVEVVKAVTHDTLYQSLVKYDSIYLDNTVFVDRSGDTIYIRENHLQYKYKFLHDTILTTKTDTVSVVQKVSSPGDPYIPPWCIWLTAIGATGIIAVILFISKQ